MRLRNCEQEMKSRSSHLPLHREVVQVLPSEAGYLRLGAGLSQLSCFGLTPKGEVILVIIIFHLSKVFLRIASLN